MTRSWFYHLVQVLAAALSKWAWLRERALPVDDHAFANGVDTSSDRCAYIVIGEDWTAGDPVRCRRSRAEHRR